MQDKEYNCEKILQILLLIKDEIVKPFGVINDEYYCDIESFHFLTTKIPLNNNVIVPKNSRTIIDNNHNNKYCNIYSNFNIYGLNICIPFDLYYNDKTKVCTFYLLFKP